METKELIMAMLSFATFMAASMYIVSIPDTESYKTRVGTTNICYKEKWKEELVLYETETIVYESDRLVTLIDENAELVRNNKDAKSSIDKIIISKKEEESIFNLKNNYPKSYIGSLQKIQTENLFNKYNSINSSVKKNILDSITVKYNKDL